MHNKLRNGYHWAVRVILDIKHPMKKLSNVNKLKKAVFYIKSIVSLCSLWLRKLIRHHHYLCHRFFFIVISMLFGMLYPNFEKHNERKK